MMLVPNFTLNEKESYERNRGYAHRIDFKEVLVSFFNLLRRWCTIGNSKFRLAHFCLLACNLLYSSAGVATSFTLSIHFSSRVVTSVYLRA